MNKKAQHEIAGFVIIVVIVTIVGLIFLSFAIGRGPTKQKSVEISNLLGASMYYTTDCAINHPYQYKELQDLIKACFKSPNQECLNSRNVCEALEYTLKGIIDTGLQIKEGSVNKGYKLRLYYDPLNELESREELLSVEEGIFQNCTSKPGGSHSVRVSGGGFSTGEVNVELEVCKR